MTIRQGPIAALAIIAAASFLSGCSQMKDRQGYMLDETLVSSIQPGVDNRDSVTGSLGRPSFTGQFDQRDWYYFSRGTQNLGFQKPRAVDQTVLHIKFDEAGNVVSVNRTGLERVASISPSGDETPTTGRKKGFFEELFGNVGTVLPGGGGASPGDIPQ